jgi:hypothetical protein
MSSPSSVSTIATARAALYELLLADAPDRTANVPTQLPKPIQISFGPPAHEEQEVVALLGVRNNDEDTAALGARRRAESYELEVGVKVHNPAAGPITAEAIAGGKPTVATVDARGFELAEWVRSVVHGHWTLSGTVRTAAVTRQLTDGVQLGEKGALIFFLLTIECEAEVVDTGAAP